MDHQATKAQRKAASGYRQETCEPHFHHRWLPTGVALVASCLGGDTLFVLLGSAALAGLLAIASASPALGQAPAGALNLVISPRQPFVVESDSARIVLHILNASSQTVWLYRRARGKRPPPEYIQDENQPPPTTGGSTVQVKLQPADPHAAQAVVSPATFTILEYVEMPKPRLVKVAPGGEYEEASIVQIHPALAEGQKPIWGPYQISVVYGASYSNGDDLQRSLGVDLWQGEITSNVITIDLRPSLPDSLGEVSGSALNADLRPRAGIRVSLSDEQGQVMDQRVTDQDGKFSFTHLPLALYWLTARWDEATNGALTYRHTELTRAAPSANVQLVLYSPDAGQSTSVRNKEPGPTEAAPAGDTDPKKLVHKPVLARVFDSGGRPQEGIELDAIYFNGDVIDDVKAVTGSDGTATMELLPGRSTVSLQRRGCREQDERTDVAPGRGVDFFKFIFDCTRK